MESLLTNGDPEPISVGETTQRLYKHRIQRRAQRAAAPTNLRVFEDCAHPTYKTGQDIAVNWPPTSELRFGFNETQTLDFRADATLLQVLTTGGTLKGELAFGINTGPVIIPNAQLVPFLRAETDFRLRALRLVGWPWQP